MNIDKIEENNIDKNKGYIYLLQIRDENGNKVYKIGKSRILESRLKDYKFKIILFTIKTNNYNILENKLIELIKNKYKIVAGREYFYSNNEEELIYFIINNISIINNYNKNIEIEQNKNIKKIELKYNNITINNYSENYIKGFNEDWDISKIDHQMKEKILISNLIFSKTLEYILNNDVNLNVILNDEIAGIVYNNDKKKYEPMSKKDIIIKSMEKIFKYLKIFYDDIINNNINELSPYLLENIKKDFEDKYILFLRLKSSQNILNESFTSIYNNKKNDSCKKYNYILSNKK